MEGNGRVSFVMANVECSLHAKFIAKYTLWPSGTITSECGQ